MEPYLKKDIEMLEKVQKRATRLMFRDKYLSYDERLQKRAYYTRNYKIAWGSNRNVQNFQRF